MMPNGMPGPAPMQQTMQRPQPGNLSQQLPAKIFADIRATMSRFQGSWQATYDPRDRANRVLQLVTQLRFIKSDPHRCVEIAIQFELKAISEAQNKEQYIEQMQRKYNEICEKRKQQVVNAGLVNNGQMGANNGMNMQNGMMNMSGMQNNNGMNNMVFQNGNVQGGGQMGGQNAIMQAQAQLQRPMQASPMPMQQQQQQQGATMNPSALQMNQIQHQQQQQIQQQQILQQQAQAQAQAQAQQQAQQMRAQNVAQQGQQQQPNANQGQSAQAQAALQEAMMQAQKIFNNMPEDQRNMARQKLLAGWNDHTRAQMTQGGGDPLMRFLTSKARGDIQKRQNMQNGGQQNKPGMPMGNNGMTMQMSNNMQQRPQSQAGQNIDYSSIMGQQANALKQQESGEQVVPASNNPNGNAGNPNNMNQMNLPQNVNPQMLGNQAGQVGQVGQGANGNSMNPNQMQMFFAQQKDAQQREAIQKQMMARQTMASRQQQSQLQGQPGGLHTPNAFGNNAPGQVNSPAMPMLNRPMAAPGQTTPGTPQTNRQQPMPATPMNPASQIAQHHQNMLNQNTQQQQQQQMGQMPSQLTNQQLMVVMSRLSPDVQAKLRAMPSHQAQAILTKMATNVSRQPQQAQQGQQGQSGQQGMPNMGAPEQPKQQAQMMQQNVANAIPGFNAQPPMDQQAMTMEQAAQMQQARIQQQQQQRMRGQAMDLMPFPKMAPSQLQIAVPQGVVRWGDLKMHINQNMTTVPPGTLERASQMQQAWFQSHPEEVNNAIKNLHQQQSLRMQQLQMQQQQSQQQQHQMQLQQQQQAPPGQMANNSSQPQPSAPPAQMVPPAPMMQTPNQGQQTGQDGGQQRMPQFAFSAQEVMDFRAKLPANQQNLPDANIRSALQRMRETAIHKAAQSAQLQAQQQRNMMQAGQMPGPPAHSGVAPQAKMSNANQAAQRTQQTHQQGNDDVVEISSQAAKQHVPQAPNMQVDKSQTSQPQMPRPTPEMLAKLSPAEREAFLQKAQRFQQAQREALRKAQGQAGPPVNPNPSQAPSMAMNPNQPKFTPAQAELMSKMYNEVVRDSQKGPAVMIDAAGHEKARASMRKLWIPLHRIGSTFGFALTSGMAPQRLKEVLEWQILIRQNASGPDGNIKDYLSVTPERLAEIEIALGNYMSEVKQRRNAMELAQAKAAQAQNVSPPQAKEAPPMAQKPSQQGHVRKASATSKVPPAPTDNKTFDWSSTSPHGVPKYEPGRNELTPDKLKFPPSKKRKMDSQGSTPAAQQGGTPAAPAASPAIPISKPSPEIARKNLQQLQQQQQRMEAQREADKHKFRCQDTTCDASLQGFETDEQLKQHMQTLHQPVEDPLAFLLEQAAKALDVDMDGKPLASSPPAAAVAAPSNGRLTIRDLKKEDLTKYEQEQLNKGITPASVKAKLAKKQDDLAGAAHKAKMAKKKELTLGESIAQKIGLPMAAEPATTEGATEEKTQHTPGRFDHVGPNYLNEWVDDCPIGPDGWYEYDHYWRDIEDRAHYEVHFCQFDPVNDTWELRDEFKDAGQSSSPELTPDSSSSQSSHDSDVGEGDAAHFMLTMEDWNESGGVPESMIPLYQKIKDMRTEDEDLVMADAGGEEGAQEKEGNGAEASKKRKAEMDGLVTDFQYDYFKSMN
ncbi:unnamed protein product [Zymoseptoria tritici ST99CH_1E4]|uniref:Mediator complex subunit 15 KIX domain-containing protein n=1 Tax=Zymoseptoria tritici ST99CH_1E4 TaxID=1276532 RepID=A0A2H1FL06_ZYMTR|nr:unnamed protein product [Zymoseptoria tritici ST99CH_1E4]